MTFDADASQYSWPLLSTLLITRVAHIFQAQKKAPTPLCIFTELSWTPLSVGSNCRGLIAQMIS